ncbi:MAG: cytochrome c oxidase subunit II [Flavobacteriales bacterium]
MSLITILFVLVSALTLVTVVKLLSVSNLVNRVRGRKPYEITEGENNVNALLCLFMLFFGYAIYFYFHFKYVTTGQLLPASASLHGEEIDTLQTVSFVIISIAYLLVQPVLWYFAFRYRYRKNAKAFHYSHNNRLEMVWTIIPALVFCSLIFYGLKIWNDIFSKEIEGEKITMELYAKQFEWAARYAGADKELGDVNYTMISDKNALGMITPETIDSQLVLINSKRTEVLAALAAFPTPEELPELEKQRDRLNHQLKMVSGFKKKNETAKYLKGHDDIIIPSGGEIHIPVNRPIELKMRSQDVIHSAYLPHFRVHMYCVPGLTTSFTFVPTITSQEMKAKLNNDKFDYLVYCNNICGSAHFNMQMKIVVETEEQYNRWLEKQQTFALAFKGEAPATEASPAPADSAKTDSAAVPAAEPKKVAQLK